MPLSQTVLFNVSTPGGAGQNLSEPGKYLLQCLIIHILRLVDKLLIKRRLESQTSIVWLIYSFFCLTKMIFLVHGQFCKDLLSPHIDLFLWSM